MTAAVAVAAAAASLLLASPSETNASTRAGSTSAATSNPDVERDFVDRINALRAQKGLRTLTIDDELTSIGRRWAAHMSKNGLAHNPNFQNEVAQDWALLGENVGTGSSVRSIMDAFIASPSHYKNLVEPRFEEIGVGVVIGGDGRIWTAHQFMQLRSQPAPAASKTPPPPPAPSKPRATPPAGPGTPTAPAPSTPAPPPAQLSPRVVLVLEQLRALDVGHPRG